MLSNVQTLNDSIAEKIGQMIPDIVSKIKEEILTESRSFSKNSGVQVSEEIKSSPIKP